MLRLPIPALRPFVALLWSQPAAPHRAAPARYEHVLPTGRMHLAVRLGDAPLCLVDAAGRTIATPGHAVLGGARDGYYAKLAGPSAGSVGAQFLPGAARALFGVAAGELAGRHVPLEALCGAAAAGLRARLIEEACPQRRLELLEAFLAARLPRARGLHPAVAEALAGLAGGGSVAELVASSGYSHRHLTAAFRDAVGLTPQRFRRVLRFQVALAAHRREPGMPWVRVAHLAGYSDQAHFVREFRAFTGVRPGDYRRAAPVARHHLPVDADRVDSIQDAGRAPG
ncbi:helix-turn-helix domain-containing protein [Luteimonas sp. RD2P54]|uniref:Helix-turn-helix domain-containing protein n=1 Tax=Luteimonas endophytica TaxID=3042023 RepID=A0ABT6JA80_9GAMM|nr:helix-turn-helix domain-containing protein [Luteimonas endophytica]MDH5823654.1 helix-turn-helix domain-containing protein [Luteimonas endophytica]